MKVCTKRDNELAIYYTYVNIYLRGLIVAIILPNFHQYLSNSNSMTFPKLSWIWYPFKKRVKKNPKNEIESVNSGEGKGEKWKYSIDLISNFLLEQIKKIDVFRRN